MTVNVAYSIIDKLTISKAFNSPFINCAERSVSLNRSILVMWLECRFLDTEVEGSNPGISMLCP